jgi:hypothetical protein
MEFKQKQWAAVFLGIASIEAALVYKLIAGQPATSATEIIVAICIIGSLLVLSPNLDGLRELSLGKEGFRVQLAELQKKTSEHERAIVNLILLSMGRDAYHNLTKLARPSGFGQYEIEPFMGLWSELYHLRNLGYIDLDQKTSRSIHEIPKSGGELSDYIKVTSEGKKYIELHEQFATKE